MRLTLIFLLFSNVIYSQNPFDLIEQFSLESSVESYYKLLEDSGYHVVPEDNTDREQHFRKDGTDIYLITSSCNHIVISSTYPNFNKSIEQVLQDQADRITTSTEYGREKHSWSDKLNDDYFVLVNPNGSYKLYYARCTNVKPLGSSGR